MNDITRTIMVSAAITLTMGSAAGEGNNTLFYAYYLLNGTELEWNLNTTETITEPSIVCGTSVPDNSTLNVSEFYPGPLGNLSGLVLNDSNGTHLLPTSNYSNVFSGGVFSEGCAKSFVITPGVWDGRSAVMWTRDGNLTVFYSGACTRRELNTWSNYCPAQPCGTGHHTEISTPVREETRLMVNGRLCGTDNITYHCKQGMDSHAVESHGAITCRINPNESIASVTLEHYCSSLVLIEHETLSCGWKLVCNSEEAYQNCNFPLQSPPPVCVPAPCWGANASGSSRPMSGGLSGATPCPGCHRIPDPSSSCWDCKVTPGSSGGVNSTDVYSAYLSMPLDITVNGFYDDGPASISAFVNLSVNPDVVAGFILGDLYYDYLTFEPKHILYRRKSAEGPEISYYGIDDLYGYNRSHENDSHYYDYVYRETFVNHNPVTSSRWATVNGMTEENGTYKISFTVPKRYANPSNLTFGVATIGDILTAPDENTSCQDKSNCLNSSSHCVSGACKRIELPANQTLILIDSLHERTSTTFDVEASGKIKPGNIVTITTRLLSENSPGLSNRTISVRVDEYQLNQNLTTDETGSAEFNLTLSKQPPILLLTFPGDSVHKGARETHRIRMMSLSSPLLDVNLILLLLYVVFLIALVSRWLGSKSFDAYEMWEDIKGVLK